MCFSANAGRETRAVTQPQQFGLSLMENYDYTTWAQLMRYVHKPEEWA